MDLFEEFKHLVSCLKKARIEFALCGGLAMAVYAYPRATIDIDIMIEPASLKLVKELVKKLGFNIDSGLMKFKEGSIQIYRICKPLTESEEPLILDLVLVTSQILDVWESRTEVTWEEGSLPVVSPLGLIHLKSLRGSGQDKDDIKQLKELLDET